MSRRENEEQLVEARLIQREIAEAAWTLTAVAARLSDLVAQLNAEADGEGDL